MSRASCVGLWARLRHGPHLQSAVHHGSLVYAPAELSTLRRLTPGARALSLGRMTGKKPSEEDVLLAALFRAGDRLDKRLERERPKAN